jgi:predicted O-linked N-acetylglucosamine transferase (SPINDLY family)
MSRVSRILEAERLFVSGELDKARQALTRVLQSAPADPDANNLMAVVLHAQGDLARAVFFAERAASANPNDPRLPANHAQLLLQSGAPDKAVSTLTRAISRHADRVELHAALVNTLSVASRFVDAADAAREALARWPDDERLAAPCIALFIEMGRVDDAIALARAAVAAHPGSIQLASQLAHASRYPWTLSREEVLRLHQNFASVLESLYPAPPRVSPRVRAPGEKLRVAILSGDFRTHSVAFFVEPLLTHFDRSRFEIFCYATGTLADATTRRLMPLATRFVRVGELAGEPLAARVRADTPDLALELSGHTACQTLAAMHHRVAPAQATYLGYAGTTGVPALDFRVVDSHTDPAGSEGDCVERLVRLDPCFLCYTPPRDIPGVTHDPSAPGVRFGSFNAIAKLNERLGRLWARVLDATPHSSLLVKSSSFLDEGLRREVHDRLSRWGLPADRVEILSPALQTRDHLAQYARVDIALDTFPYHGTTTTCEALLMGVPVVTLAGDTHASRVGVSILTNVGEPGLIAASEDDYVRIASGLAADSRRRGELRATLRARLLASPLCDAVAFTRRFERAMEDMVAPRG